jgi:phosphate transport system permease protein
VDVIALTNVTFKKRTSRAGEQAIRWWLFACSLLSIITTAAIIYILLRETVVFFTSPLNVDAAGVASRVSIWEFLTGTRWTPLLKPQSFGVLPLVCGTMLVTVGAAIIAVPLGLASAIYLSEYASHRLRAIVKPILEILAGVPTVIYGYFALTFITPLMQRTLDPTLQFLFGPNAGVQVFNAASASIVVGIMILPLVISLCDDAFAAVPDALRQGGYAMGATKFEVSTQVLLPAALSGVLASFILAISRAIGETMAVTLAAGGSPKMTFNLFEGIQTMTAYIVQVSLGDTPHGSVEYQTIFAVGAVLFVITLVLNIAAHKIVRRFREAYE